MDNTTTNLILCGERYFVDFGRDVVRSRNWLYGHGGRVVRHHLVDDTMYLILSLPDPDDGPDDTLYVSDDNHADDEPCGRLSRLE